MPKRNIWFIVTLFEDFSSDVIKDSIYICFLLKKFLFEEFLLYNIFIICVYLS